MALELEHEGSPHQPELEVAWRRDPVRMLTNKAVRLVQGLQLGKMTMMTAVTDIAARALTIP